MPNGKVWINRQQEYELLKDVPMTQISVDEDL